MLLFVCLTLVCCGILKTIPELIPINTVVQVLISDAVQWNVAYRPHLWYKGLLASLHACAHCRHYSCVLFINDHRWQAVFTAVPVVSGLLICAWGTLSKLCLCWVIISLCYWPLYVRAMYLAVCQNTLCLSAWWSGDYPSAGICSQMAAIPASLARHPCTRPISQPAIGLQSGTATFLSGMNVGLYVFVV